MRTFDSGATRDSDDSKPDYEGFVSPLVTKRFGQYMTVHRKQADGNIRASDNWQKGIPRDAYIKSLCRHLEDLRLHHDGYPEEAVDKDLESVLCACLFNVQGYLYELLRLKRTGLPETVLGLPVEVVDSLPPVVVGRPGRTLLEERLDINRPEAEEKTIPAVDSWAALGEAWSRRDIQDDGAIYGPCPRCEATGKIEVGQSGPFECYRCHGRKVVQIGQNNTGRK